jgi:hypothetical protein
VAVINVDFPWARGRTYEIVKPANDEPYIRQTGKNEKPEFPLQNPHLYLDFAQLDGSPESCLRFAKAWGLLKTQAGIGEQERLSFWRDQIREMRQTIEGLRRTIEEHAVPPLGFFVIDEVEVRLIINRLDGRPALSFQPRLLVRAMRVQLAQSIASGKSIDVCQACNKWFETGGRGAGVKRAKTKFCSDKHRNDYHYDQRRAGK